MNYLITVKPLYWEKGLNLCSGEGIVALYAVPNPSLLNKICLNQEPSEIVYTHVLIKFGSSLTDAPEIGQVALHTQRINHIDDTINVIIFIARFK